MTYDDAAYVEENDFWLCLAAHLRVDTLENVFHWSVLGQHSEKENTIGEVSLIPSVTNPSKCGSLQSALVLFTGGETGYRPRKGALRYCRTSACLTGMYGILSGCRWTRGGVVDGR